MRIRVSRFIRFEFIALAKTNNSHVKRLFFWAYQIMAVVTTNVHTIGSTNPLDFYLKMLV